jgi:cytochrome subunit of sulfide dehydrogenase
LRTGVVPGGPSFRGDATIEGRRIEEEEGMHPYGVATAVVTALGLLGGASFAAAEPSVQMLADTCAVCHGTDGRSPGSIDDLYRMDPDEFVEEMLEFKNQGEGRIMAPLARAFTEQQIHDLARYFARLGG